MTHEALSAMATTLLASICFSVFDGAIVKYLSDEVVLRKDLRRAIGAPLRYAKQRNTTAVFCSGVVGSTGWLSVSACMLKEKLLSRDELAALFLQSDDFWNEIKLLLFRDE